MRILYTILLILSFTFTVSSYSQSVINSIPNPKDHGGGWVSNPDNILKQHEVDSINRLITEMERLTTAQMAVVVVNSIGDETPKDVAFELFRKWGIGNKEKNNGLLLLVVLNPKRWEFETGYGLEGDLPDVTLLRLGRRHMSPHFKEGAYGAGIIEGIKEISAVLQNATTYDNDTSSENQSIAYKLLIFFLIVEGIAILTGLIMRYAFTKNKKEQLPVTLFYTLLLVPISIGLINYEIRGLIFDHESFWLYLLLLYMHAIVAQLINRLYKNRSIKGNTPHDRYLSFSKSHEYLVLWAIFTPITMLPYLIWFNKYKKQLREAPRISKKGLRMRKLSNSEEKAFLSGGQQKEEEIESIEYDVWITEDGSETNIEAYKNPLSQHGICPECNYKTNNYQGEKTIEEATFSKAGKGIKTYRCAHCKHTVIKEFTIPKLEGSVSIYNSSDSSSSSSTSSFGGGESGGGGAGDSW